MDNETKAPKKNAGNAKKENIFKRMAASVVTFFKGVKAEFKKIIWPSQETLTKETVATLSVSVLLCLIIAILDALMRSGVELLVK